MRSATPAFARAHPGTVPAADTGQALMGCNGGAGGV